MNILGVPEDFSAKDDYLVDFYAQKFGVSRGRLLQAMDLVGGNAGKLRKHINDGVRIAIRDSAGRKRLVARVTTETNGFGVSAPYHYEKIGWLIKQPVRYDKKEFSSPLHDAEHFKVSGTVKLSVHLDGFVQFSRGGSRPIVSGYCEERGIKGIGLRAPDDVDVTTGPLLGVVVNDLEGFKIGDSKHAEVFDQNDLWHHPEFSTADDSAFHVEVFVFSSELIDHVTSSNGRRVYRRELPFNSKLDFLHELRVIELPKLPIFLGVIVSNIRPPVFGENAISGYSLVGPGCKGQAGKMYNIQAIYPYPEVADEFSPKSLDYEPEVDSDDNNCE